MAYRRLTHEDRELIMLMLGQGYSFTAIASALHRSISTVSRQVAANRTSTSHYSAYRAEQRAQRYACQHHTQRKLDRPRLWRVVRKKLKLRWSPEQIAQYLKARYPQNPAMHVSHESIYAFLYVQGRGQLKKELLEYLRQKHKTRYTRLQGPDRRGKIPDMISIHQRPPEVADRTVPGHWEGDLIKGTRNKSAMGTLVERTTRFVILVPLNQWDASSVRKAYARAMRRLPSHLRLSITYDQGAEMSEHVQFTMDTKIAVYFADPHSPWMRGTNENTNGLLRDFFPKSTDFTTVSTRRIRAVQHMLNERPRKTLGWQTPKQAFATLLKQTGA